jgi:hypothetical protein
MTSGRDLDALARQPAAVTAGPAETSAATPAPVRNKRANRLARVKAAAVATAPTPEESTTPRLVKTIPVSAPELQKRMKPVLARGTKLPVAVEGFTNAEQFATVAHAARNTQVPFILLKHRVLVEGQSLEAAIAASRPELDARLEVQRARTAAKSDIAAVSAGTSMN